MASITLPSSHTPNWKPPQLDRCRDPPVSAFALPICIIPPTMGMAVKTLSTRKKLSDETRTRGWVSGAWCSFFWVTSGAQPHYPISTFEKSSFLESDGRVCGAPILEQHSFLFPCMSLDAGLDSYASPRVLLYRVYTRCERLFS